MDSISSLSLFRYFLFVGATCFGGPLAIIEKIRYDLVLKRNWITTEEFNDYFGYAQMAPGPLAFQVALYVGYYKKGFIGAVLSGFGLVFPSFLIVLIFSFFYKIYKDIDYIKFALYGFSPVIIAIILKSGFSLSKSIFKKDYFLYSVFLISVIATIFFEVHILYLIIGSALAAIIFYITIKKSQLNSISIYILLIFAKIITSFIFFFSFVKEFFNQRILEIVFLFLKVGALTYGSGFVIVGVLRQEVVDNYKWLNAKEFIDGIAFGQITPGPVVITSTFIGYMIEGVPGSILSTFCIFLPTFIIVMILASKIQKFKDNIYLKSAIKGANAAALGAILSTAYLLSKDAIIDIASLLIFVAATGILFFTKIKEYYIILFSIAISIIIKFIFF